MAAKKRKTKAAARAAKKSSRREQPAKSKAALKRKKLAQNAARLRKKYRRETFTAALPLASSPQSFKAKIDTEPLSLPPTRWETPARKKSALPHLASALVLSLAAALLALAAFLFLLGMELPYALGFSFPLFAALFVIIYAALDARVKVAG